MRIPSVYIILVLALLLGLSLLACGEELECDIGERECEGTTLKTCYYGKWVSQICKDASPICDKKHGCIKATSHCGNGVIEQDEICDSLNLNGRTCNDVGEGLVGELRCTDTCQLDISDCHKEAVP